MLKIIIHQSKDGQFYFTVNSRNGRVILTSETYKKEGNCIKSARLVAGCSKFQIRYRNGSRAYGVCGVITSATGK